MIRSALWLCRKGGNQGSETVRAERWMAPVRHDLGQREQVQRRGPASLDGARTRPGPSSTPPVIVENIEVEGPGFVTQGPRCRPKASSVFCKRAIRTRAGERRVSTADHAVDEPGLVGSRNRGGAIPARARDNLFSRAAKVAKSGALQAAGKRDSEGGGGFNPRTKPAESEPALAVDRLSRPFRPKSRVFPQPV